MTAPDLPCAAVLLDCDGVLVDSRSAGEQAWRTWATEHGVEFAELLVSLHGRRSADTVAQWVPEAGRRSALARIEELELRSAPVTRALPGAGELLAQVFHVSAIVTSASARLIDARLRAAGLPRPAVVVTGEDVVRGKPHPDPYLRAAEFLGVPVSDCVVVEDSPLGLVAARAAGAAAVLGIGPFVTNADENAPDLAGVTWGPGGLHLDRDRVTTSSTRTQEMKPC